MNCQYCTTSKHQSGKCKICRNIYFNSTNQKFDIEGVKKSLDKYGVVVIENWFDLEESKQLKQETIDWLIDHSLNLTEEYDTWISANLPYGPRAGMMQSLIGHSPPAWKVREKMYPIFRKLHSTKLLYTSMDGATVYPPVPPKRNGKDWPHIDQTTKDPLCFQGQAVLTTSSAAFRCTPKSHLEWKKIMEICEKSESSDNWLKMTPQKLEEIKSLFKYWQMPIYTKAGSVILWNSKTIHSSQPHQEVEDDDWRCVFYVCMRPQEQFTKRNLTTLKKCVKECRTTNHWGTRMFGKRQGLFRGGHNRAEDVEELTEQPEQIGSILDNNPSKIIKRITVS